MTDEELVVVFDLVDAGFRNWWFPAFGLMFVMIGLLLFRYPTQIMQLSRWDRYPRLYKAFSWFFLSFAILWTVVSFIAVYVDYRSMRTAYTNAEHRTVEGRVEQFHPMSKGGGKYERFTVAGQEFRYSDFYISTGFNQSRAHGGPIDEGVYVRILHVDGQIVRLEVERSAVEHAAGRKVEDRKTKPQSYVTPFPNFSNEPIFRYSWIFFIVIIGLNAAIWRWRGRAYIAKDASLRNGYNKLTMGMFLWSSAPFALTGIMDTAGQGLVPERYNQTIPHLSPLLQITFLLVVAKWIYWTFYQNGIAKMVRHPGIMDHAWIAKSVPVVVGVAIMLQVAIGLILPRL